MPPAFRGGADYFLAATPPEAKPHLFNEMNGKPEAFRTGGGIAEEADPELQI